MLHMFLAGPKTERGKNSTGKYSKEQYRKDIERLLQKGIIKKVEDEEKKPQFIASYTR